MMHIFWNRQALSEPLICNKPVYIGWGMHSSTSERGNFVDTCLLMGT